MAGPSKSPGFAVRVEQWIGIASAVLVLAIAGLLVREALVRADEPPVLRGEILLPADEATPQAQVRFVVRNEGGQTATAISIALVLRDGDEVVDRQRLTLDYLPGHSEATGGFVLAAGAEALRPEIVVEGYLDP
jgi:uncharacterized protein (TIGR02588 family)